jgi:hypothetical protein
VGTRWGPSRPLTRCSALASLAKGQTKECRGRGKPAGQSPGARYSRRTPHECKRRRLACCANLQVACAIRRRMRHAVIRPLAAECAACLHTAAVSYALHRDIRPSAAAAHHGRIPQVSHHLVLRGPRNRRYGRDPLG